MPVITDSERSVRYFQAKQADVLDLPDVEVFRAADEMDLLFESELFKQGFGVSFDIRGGR